MRGEGTGLYNLSRNIGSSVGIAVVTALITENVQSNHASIAAYVTPFNHAFNAPAVDAEPRSHEGGGPRRAGRDDHDTRRRSSLTWTTSSS